MFGFSDIDLRNCSDIRTTKAGSSLDFELFHFLPKGRSGDPKKIGGDADVSFGVAENPQNMASFAGVTNLLQGWYFVFGGGFVGLGEDVLSAKDIAIGQRYRPLYPVPKLSDVARPIVGENSLFGGR